jgi:hypothetical protein
MRDQFPHPPLPRLRRPPCGKAGPYRADATPLSRGCPAARRTLRNNPVTPSRLRFLPHTTGIRYFFRMFMISPDTPAY